MQLELEAVREASVRQQLLGCRNVGRARLVETVLVARVERRIAAEHAAVGTGSQVADHLAVDRKPDGLAHARIVEGLHVGAEHDAAPIACHDLLHLVLARALEQCALLLGDARQHVDLTPEQRLHARLRVRNGDDLHRLDERRALEIVAVGLEDRHAARLEFLKLEGAGAYACGLDGVAGILRDNHQPVVRQDQGQVGERRLELHLDGQRIDRIDGVDDGDDRADGAVELGILDAAERVDDIVRREGLAVMELDVRPELKGPLGRVRIGAPAHGEVGSGLAVEAGADEPAHQLLGDLEDAAGRDRIEARVVAGAELVRLAEYALGLRERRSTDREYHRRDGGAQPRDHESPPLVSLDVR